jgi:tetratricopeptide (TPR) repeat protein
LNIGPYVIAVSVEKQPPSARSVQAAAPRRPSTADFLDFSAPAAPPPLVDISGLPETGYERLVGRDAELQRLDDAWSDGKTNILSLVAEGGAGKSALVNEWLKRLQADFYRGAERVQGWSFYSQGSKERPTSADEFLNWALNKLGVEVESTSAVAKGEAIAEALMARRVILLLDGVEPLQHGPGPQAGQLKDQGLRALLRRFAASSPRADHSLIVLTSRLAIADIQRFKDGSAPVVDVERLSEEAGAELLRDNDVWGIDKELRAASRDFGGHPLALTLLASLLKETQNGDVRRRDHVRELLADSDNPRHDQARRVMESYEREWLADQPILLNILHCVGLFDRPATSDCLKALRATPVIPGLTDELIGLSDEQWRRAVARLRDVRLLAPRDPSDLEALDAHPLVREWFGERLRQTNEAAWKAAHSRLYDHLRDTTKEGQTPTLADLTPLYHAIAHGCRAGRYQEALVGVYIGRICRQSPDQTPEFYTSKKLGALSSNLAAIAWFFDRPYEAPSAALVGQARSFVVNQASFALRAQGRLREALQVTRASLDMTVKAKEWANAATDMSILNQTELLIGEVSAAVETAKRGVGYANKSSDVTQMLGLRADYGDALHLAGESDKAQPAFAAAERLLRYVDPGEPWLYALAGFQYCDLLLARQQAVEVRDRAQRALSIARRNQWMLHIALDTLTLGRAHIALALQRATSGPVVESVRTTARASGEQFDAAIEGLRASGEHARIARGLLARAAFLRAVGDWEGMAHDLDEAEEIGEPGPMRLYLCDCALERARLALARREAFAPLAGLVEPSPPPPVLPDTGAGAALREEARKQLGAARKLIAECGYHRRDEELAELDAVAAGRRRFADLPPRV